ncbi:unnamed protein product, partial [marine sediment metagenome]
RLYRTRAFQKQDAQKVLAIYNDNNRRRTCSTIRTPQYFATFPKKSQEFVVIEDSRRRIVAYAISDKSTDRADIHEIGTRTDDVLPTLLGALAKVAIKRRLGELKIFLPPDHPFARFCHQYDCRFTTGYHKNSGALIRMLNQDSLFLRLRKDWNRRIAHSAFREHSGSLRFATDIGDTTLEIRRGSLEVRPGRKARTLLPLSQGQLTQLLVGYRGPQEILREADVEVSPKVLSLLNVLFPKQYCHLWDVSRFEGLRLRPEDFDNHS